MSTTPQLYQTTVLVIVVLIFDTLERRRPRLPIDRHKNLSLNVLALGVVIFGGEAWKRLIQEGLAALSLGSFSFLDIVHLMPGAAKIVVGLVLADLCLYWVHRAMHRRTLWFTHKFHHSIDELWWLAGSRTSLSHLFLFAVPQIFLADYVLGLTTWEAGIAFSVGIVVNVWIHTNISVDLGLLEWLFITPDYHRVHHGSRGLSNNNLGFILTIWDRMFGTYIDSRTVKDFPLGAISTRKGLVRMIAGL